MSRRSLWILYISSMAIIIASIVVILMKQKSPEERALEDYYHGIKLYNLKHYDEALAKFKLAIHLDPDLVDAYYYVALATEERSYEEAAGEWERYLEVIEEKGTGKDEGWDEKEIAKRHLAWCYYEVGMSSLEKGKAVDYLEKFLDVAGEMDEMEEMVSEAEERLEEIELGEWDEMNKAALEYYYSAIRYKEQDEFEEAVKKFRLAISEDPEFVDAYFQLAMVLEEISYEESIDAWEKYIEVASSEYKPGDEEYSDIDVAREHMIWSYFRAGMEEENPSKAREYLNDFIELAQSSEGWEENIEEATEKLEQLE